MVASRDDPYAGHEWDMPTGGFYKPVDLRIRFSLSSRPPEIQKVLEGRAHSDEIIWPAKNAHTVDNVRAIPDDGVTQLITT